MIDDEMFENSSKMKSRKEITSMNLSKIWEKIKGRYCKDLIASKEAVLFTRGARLCVAFPVVFFFFTAFGIMSCADDLRSSGGDDQTDAVIRLTINTETPQKASTRNVDEYKIHDLYVLVYNSSGELIGKSYSIFDTSASSYNVTVNARSGDGCTIYAIANTNSTTLFDGAAVNTEDKLKAIATSSTAWGDLNNSSSTSIYLPMSGSTQADISAGATTLFGGITVKRLVAKVTLNVGIASGSGVVITGYRIYGVPRKSYYVARPLNTEESATDTQVTRAEDACLPASVSDWMDSGLISLSDVTLFDTSFYLYENRAGVNTAITVQNEKNATSAPDSAAYVMIYGMAPGYASLSWKVYLGANNTTNFNIKRNFKYTCTVTLKPNDADIRINYIKPSIVWAGSNIYWDEANQKLTFDPIPVYPGSPTEQELTNMKKQGVCFRWGSLVGVSLSNTIVIYTPTYNFTSPTISTWANATGTVDDFNNIAYFTDSITDVSQTNTFLNDAAQNTDSNYVKYRGDICQYLSKTQPSLGSWRMPTAKEFNAAGLADGAFVSWTTSTTPWAEFSTFDDQTNNVDTKGTFLMPSGGTYTVNGASTSFPASGYRHTDGTLGRVGQFGLYWSSSPYSTDSYVLYFNLSKVYPAVNSDRKNGFEVRCVQN